MRIAPERLMDPSLLYDIIAIGLLYVNTISGEGQSGVIRLEDLVSGRQQVRSQEHSVRALRYSIARTLLVGSFRDFSARLADSPLLQWFCKIAQLERVKCQPKVPYNVMRIGNLKKICGMS
jgi:hypothetical protein